MNTVTEQNLQLHGKWWRPVRHFAFDVDLTVDEARFILNAIKNDPYSNFRPASKRLQRNSDFAVEWIIWRNLYRMYYRVILTGHIVITDRNEAQLQGTARYNLYWYVQAIASLFILGFFGWSLRFQEFYLNVILFTPIASGWFFFYHLAMTTRDKAIRKLMTYLTTYPRTNPKISSSPDK